MLQRRKDLLERKPNVRVAHHTTIPELLGLDHRMSKTIKVETNPLVLTFGETSKSAGTKYLKRIIPWNYFANRQQEIWNIICASSTYSERLFNSSIVIKAMTLVDVRSEQDIVANDSVTVLQPVEAILQQIFKDKELRQQLQLPGYVTFLSYLNLKPGNQDVSTLPKTDHIPLSSNPMTPTNQRSKGKGAKVNAATKAQNYPKDVGGQADKFCVFILENGKEKPAYNIEYKPPFKFLAADIAQGLQGEIPPDRELINKDDKGSEFSTRRLVSP